MDKNPFSAEAVAAAASPLSEVRCHNGCTYWVTRRPSEGGRQVVMEYTPSSGTTRCITADGYSVQSRVHEYGGGCYALAGSSLFFVNSEDQCIYQQPLDASAAEILTTATEPARRVRYGDLLVSKDASFLITVREQHTDQGVINDLIRLNLFTQAIDVLASGEDFYASPALNKNNSELVFLSWSHPNMPWEKTQLWQLTLGSDEPAKKLLTDGNEAIYQPGFTDNNGLFYVSDRSGWWNLYLQEKPILPMTVDCGYPMWVLGTNQVAFQGEQAWTICGKPGEQGIVNLQGEKLELPFTDFQPTLAYNPENHCLLFIAGRYDQPDALYQFDLNSNQLQYIAKSSDHSIDTAYFSKPLCIDNEGVYGFYYPPKNAPANALPPMIVNSHGGPNGSATTQCQFKIQFWTSRGFAYLDVNYRGSTGYGREFRRALNGKWGEADIEDCCQLTQYCVEKQWCDPNKLFIRGQSAGGLTALSACVFHTVFAGGTSCYGVADLTTLVNDTHKFECRYLDTLVGPYPDKRDLYLQRSPAYHLEKLSVPLLFLQGLEDRIVPVEQTKAMTDKLDASNKPYQYVEFSNEGHGFKRAENIIQAMEAELRFYTLIAPIDTKLIEP
jgi:dipeptidyl aminopeptidase/acylaminoacyl peptidase